MFTGIVSAVGRVESASPNGGRGKGDGGRVLHIRAPYRGLKKGESIAVNGACLTIEKVVKGGFTVHAVQTTLGRTLIGEWQKGRSVNLERPVRAADLMGGHIVQGHVDGIGIVEETTSNEKASNGNAWLIRSEEHTSELQSPDHLVCRLLLEKKNKIRYLSHTRPSHPTHSICTILMRRSTAPRAHSTFLQVPLCPRPHRRT